MFHILFLKPNLTMFLENTLLVKWTEINFTQKK